MTTTGGPLVVRGDRWMLPDGRRGTLSGSVAAHAATWGLPVVLVLGEPPAALWGPGDTVEEIGQAKRNARAKPETWRYRVTVPGGLPVVLVLVDRDYERRGGPFRGLTGTETAGVLRVLADGLGVPWGHSIGRTVEHLILSTHPPRKGGRRLDRAPAVPDPARSALVEQPWSGWQRPLRPQEQGAGWVHAFDGNSAYLGAWQTTDLGFGKPAAWTGARDDLRRAGVWRVELPAGWQESPLLPPIAPGLRKGAGWVMTPTLVRLREWAAELGAGDVEPESGWVWPEQSRFLRAAGERLRDLRAAALAQEDAARDALPRVQTDEEAAAVMLRLQVALRVGDAVKDLYRVANGRLSSEEPYISAGWRRPDWGNTLRAAYRTSLHRKMSRWAQAPFAASTDAVAFVSDEPDPLVFAESIGLRVGRALGTMRHAGTAPLAAVDEHIGGGRLQLARLWSSVADWHPGKGR